ncbi:MAG: recombinase family protein, partial [Elusimicrobia bacterium]|nr:recombinase family protein [Elusimicrobiota bacterium]
MESRERKDKNAPLWCAIYTRKSTDENLNSDFTSLDSQREYCQSFIKSREGEGWGIYPEAYNDPGFSGGNMDRPALKKLLADAKQKKFQAVVCYKYDRLSRNTKDFLHVLDIFDKHGVAFVSVTQPIDTTSSVGRLMRSILMDFAQFEREMISERTRDKLAAMARKGKRTGGYPIVGYDIDKEKKILTVNPQEAVTVQEMFEIYLRTRSLWATAKSLNAKGYRMKEWTTAKGTRRGGAEFDRSNVWYLLKNPLYIGQITHRGQPLPGEHEPIVSKEDFKAVQTTLNGNGKGRKHRVIENMKHVYLLGGLLRCAACSKAMIPHGVLKKKKLSRFFYYRCLSVNKMNKDACRVRSVPAQAVEEFVIKRLGLLSQNQELINGIVETARASSADDLPAKRQNRSFLTAHLGKLEAEARNLVGILGEQGPNAPRRAFYESRLDELAAKKQELQGNLLKLDQEIIQLECQEIDASVVQGYLHNFMEILNRLGDKEKKELLRLLIREVVFDGENSRVQVALKPLPKIWGDVTQLEDRFVYCRTSLPMPYAKQTLKERALDILSRKDEFKATFTLNDPSEFGVIKVKNGCKRFLFANEAEEVRRQRGPKPPAIQNLLKKALQWRTRLQTDPHLTQTALAGERSISRVRVTQILNLLKLAPTIQGCILSMPPTLRQRGLITER